MNESSNLSSAVDDSAPSKKSDCDSSSDSEINCRNSTLAGVIKSVKSSIISSDDNNSNHSSVDGHSVKKRRVDLKKIPSKTKGVDIKENDIYNKLSSISDKLECESENAKPNNFAVQNNTNSTSDNNSCDGETSNSKKVSRKSIRVKSSIELESSDNIKNLVLIKDIKEELTDPDDVIKTEHDDSEINMASDYEGDNSELTTSKTPAKKKRGRPPRKSVTNEESKRSNVVSVSVENSQSGKKRGRGRPKKYNVAQYAETRLETEDKSRHESASTNGSSTNRSEASRKRKIIKPKRFDSYEGFEFMDVSDNTSVNPDVDNDDSIIAESLHIDEDEDDDQIGDVSGDIIEARECVTGHSNDEQDIKHKKPKGKSRIVKVALGRGEENEFDAFGKNVALQLKQVPLQDALELQIKILSLISNRRLQLSKK